jgi:hypothetical protein
VIGAVFFGGLFVFTLRYSKLARTRGEALLAESGVNYPSVMSSATSASAKRS